jgi:hypothetical protein
MNSEENLPPSYFANLGQPTCSIWGKSELEWIALAYVQALANDGDVWKSLTREQTYNLPAEEQRGRVHCLLTFEYYDHWFLAVSSRLKDAEGAFSVRGFWRKQENAP